MATAIEATSGIVVAAFCSLLKTRRFTVHPAAAELPMIKTAINRIGRKVKPMPEVTERM